MACCMFSYSSPLDNIYQVRGICFRLRDLVGFAKLLYFLRVDKLWLIRTCIPGTYTFSFGFLNIFHRQTFRQIIQTHILSSLVDSSRIVLTHDINRSRQLVYFEKLVSRIELATSTTILRRLVFEVNHCYRPPRRCLLSSILNMIKYALKNMLITTFVIFKL